MLLTCQLIVESACNVQLQHVCVCGMLQQPQTRAHQELAAGAAAAATGLGLLLILWEELGRDKQSKRLSDERTQNGAAGFGG